MVRIEFLLKCSSKTERGKSGDSKHGQYLKSFTINRKRKKRVWAQGRACLLEDRIYSNMHGDSIERRKNSYCQRERNSSKSSIWVATGSWAYGRTRTVTL